ncbi:hypothetical protein [Bifidobacterium felsineum]|uniref:Uncharacterized protein n=1 Tax=Bifidobacterium felsineum TaxID=2045440 RepID=A0A2M9HKG5_9BIFI|nr:hypothetical protein [Bifidobacterium felsineum]PJM77299.1 hypothetical protein CSQ86_05295 [Bifidobacterium felsineum]
MDERWVKALQAKNMSVPGQAKDGDKQTNSGNALANKTAVRGTSNMTMRHAQPFKATGHKGGISRQGS